MDDSIYSMKKSIKVKKKNNLFNFSSLKQKSAPGN